MNNAVLLSLGYGQVRFRKRSKVKHFCNLPSKPNEHVAICNEKYVSVSIRKQLNHNALFTHPPTLLLALIRNIKRL